MSSSINASLTTGINITSDTSGIINLQSGGTTVATISSTGLTSTGGALNGSLGATTPSTVVATTISASGVSTFSAGTAGAPAITTTGDTNTGIFFPAADTIAFSEGGTEAMRIDAGGRLLVGTTSGGAKINASSTNNNTTAANYFWVNDATVSIANLSTTTNSLASLSFYMGAGNSISAVAGVQESSTLGALAFYTGGSGRSNTVPERVRIDSNGALLVGQSSNGSNPFGYTVRFLSYAPANTAIEIKDVNGDWLLGTTGGSFTISSSTASAERMRINSGGIVSMSAYGAGAATFSAAGVISSVSDETWKTKDGVPLNPDAMLQKLEPGYWYYNEEKAPIFGAERQLGFYAQNVNEAIGVEAAPIPEEGKPWGYYDRSVLAVTVMSLQKALTTIENLTARLDEQQAQISVLQGAK